MTLLDLCPDSRPGARWYGMIAAALESRGLPDARRFATSARVPPESFSIAFLVLVRQPVKASSALVQPDEPGQASALIGSGLVPARQASRSALSRSASVIASASMFGVTG